MQLKELTTIHIGGEIDKFVECHSEEEIINSFKFADQNNLPILIIGEGSNLIPNDDEFKGFVIKDIRNDIVNNTYSAGILLENIVKQIIDSNPNSEIRALSGIPGTIGGAVVQNAGAYGREFCDFLEYTRVYDRKTKKIIYLTNQNIEPGYRSTTLKNSIQNQPSPRWIVLDVTINPNPILKENTRGNHTREEILFSRSEKGTLSPNNDKGQANKIDNDRFSAGSFFKNPIISREKFAKMNLPENAPKYDVENPERIKLSAAWLIENSGIPKGFSLPESNIALSSKHTLAITNPNQIGTRLEVEELAKYIQETVLKKYQIELSPEPIFL
ncbi:MAG: FAD-binding protein [Candidatus Ancillula sp.]|jgi:UDP-N-acetylmuramate dehydrogenase|nr:FAD-binding protein [Candidatus Ancillula sp.]